MKPGPGGNQFQIMTTLEIGIRGLTSHLAVLYEIPMLLIVGIDGQMRESEQHMSSYTNSR